MLKHLLSFTLVLTSSLPLVYNAGADPMVESMGMRVGGYGFREATPASGEAPKGTGWQACRMNGVGVFATKSLGGAFFAEAGLDTYFTDSFPIDSAMSRYSTPIDRSSALLSAALGARFYQGSRFSPYLQLGLGGELTHVSLPALALEDTALLPMAFFGAGATITVSEKVKVGGVFRLNAMGYYDDAQFQTELKPQLELATQGQFYASFTL